MLNKERPKLEYMPYNSIYIKLQKVQTNLVTKSAQWLPVDWMMVVTDYNTSRGNFWVVDMSLSWFYWWVYSALKVIKLYTLCATYCLSISTSIKLYKKQLTGKSILHRKTLYKSEHMAEVPYWEKKKSWSCCQNFFKNHTLSIFLWGLSVHSEQKVSSTFKDLPLGGDKSII